MLIAELRDADGSVVEIIEAADAVELYATAAARGLLVGNHGPLGGGEPTREVPLSKILALQSEHGQGGAHAASAAVDAILAHTVV